MNKPAMHRQACGACEPAGPVALLDAFVTDTMAFEYLGIAIWF